MSKKIVQLNEEVIKGQLKEFVRDSIEETLNEMLETETKKLTWAACYERNETRKGVTAAVITSVTLLPHLEMSHSRCSV